jgi:FAD/FMN-containing dehydrogenase
MLPLLGVLEFSFNSDADKIRQDAAMVRNLVESAFAVSAKYRILVHDALDKICSQKCIPVNNLDAALAQLREEHIDYLISGSVNSVGRDYSVALKCIDVGTGKVCSNADSFIMGSPRALSEGARSLIARLITGLEEPGPDTKIIPCPNSAIIKAVPLIASKKRRYKLGDMGPGEGFIFLVQEGGYMEVSPILGEYTWNEAMNIAQMYTGGGYLDWSLPTKTTLNYVYANLKKAQIVNLGSAWYWTSSQHYFNDAWYQSFADGYQDYSSKSDRYCVRLTRNFFLLEEHERP